MRKSLLRSSPIGIRGELDLPAAQRLSTVHALTPGAP